MKRKAKEMMNPLIREILAASYRTHPLAGLDGDLLPELGDDLDDVADVLIGSSTGYATGDERYAA